MIVADADLVSYMVIPGAHSEVADLAYKRDQVWVAPDNQRTELLNVVSKNIRGNKINLETGEVAVREAFDLVQYEQVSPTDLELLKLSIELKTTTYDSAYVWLARHLKIRLVTGDTYLARCAPDVAVTIEDFDSGK